jgi:hypothetical protein
MDFLRWLATWVGTALDDNWPEARQRAMVARTAHFCRWQGTARGIAEQVTIHTGISPEVIDTGGVAWSVTPNSPLPGSSAPEVMVRLRASDPTSIDLPAIERIVLSCKPAHVAFRVEILPL